MMSRKQVRDWVNSLAPDSSVAIDDGGLRLVEIDPDGDEIDWLEVGGIPEQEDEPKETKHQ